MNKGNSSSKTIKTIFSLCLCLGLAGLCFAQTTSENQIWQVKQKPLNQILDSLESKRGISFSYDYDLVKSIEVTKQIKLDEALDQLCESLFEDLPMVYKIDEQQNIRLIPVQTDTHLGPKEIQIVDAESGEPIPYVAISFQNGGGTETTDEGTFILPAQKEQTIRVYRIGYKEAEIDLRELKEGTTISMQPESSPLQNILVVEEEPGIRTSNTSGAIEISKTLLNQQTGSVFTADPLRTIQLLPGIGAQNDLSSEIRIRGGDADESLIILDGMTLYEAKHYYGIFSTINAGVVDKISVYKNNTPTDSEGRTSGVVDISTLPGIQKCKPFLDAQIGLMNASASTVFSLGSALQIMAGGRFTTGNPGQSRFQKLLNPRPVERTIERDIESFNVISQVPTYAFNDWNAKAQWTIGKSSTLYFTTFHSHDETQLEFNRALKIDAPNTTITVFEEDYNEQGAWDNHAYQVGSRINMSEKTTWENRLVLSKSNSFSELESTFFRRVNKDSSRTGNYSNMIANDISDIHFFSNLTIHQSNIGEMKAGIDYQRIDNTFEVEYGDLKQFGQDQKADIVSAYISRRVKTNKKTELDIGGRLAYYNPTSSLHFSPQISVTHKVQEHQKLKAAYSSPAQMLQRAYFEDLTGRAYTFWINANNKQVPVSRAHKWMVGYQQINNHFKWDIEGFYKSTKGIIELASNQLGFDPRTSGINANTQIRIYDGSSRAIGVDFLAVYETKKYTGQFSYTLSKSEQKFDNVFNGEWIPAREDSRHQVKTIHTIQLNNLAFQALWVYASGKPYTDISKIIGTPQNRNNLDPDIFQSRLKDYHRIDLGVSYNFSKPHYDLYFSIGVLNVFNRRNVKYAQYIFGQKGSNGEANTVAGTEWGLMDRTLNFTTGVRF